MPRPAKPRNPVQKSPDSIPLSFGDSLVLLTTWLADYHKLDKLTDDLSALTGSVVDSRFHKIVSQAFDHYTAAVSALVGDEFEWLSWYLYDRPNAGSVPCAAKAPSWKKPRQIRTLRQLLTLIRAK